MPSVRRPAAYAALALLLGGPALRADDAVLRDGRTVAGQLLRDDRGRLHFTAGGRSIPAGQIERVRFAVQGTPYRAPALHQAFFRSGERLTGELLRFDGQTLRLRTAWKDELAIPRHALAGVTHFADQVVFFVEDFEKEPSAWQLAGAPERSERQHTSGRYSLRLDTPGQEATDTLPRPLEAGRVGVNFFDPGPVTGARWLLVAEFGGMKEPVRVVLADGTEHYSVEAPLSSDELPPVARSPGWHRVSLRFAPGYLLVGVDGVTVWSSAKTGPGGPLRKLSLRCEATTGEKPGHGELHVDDVSLARAPESSARRAADKRQDDVWLLAGDQLFGEVTGADRRTVSLRTRFGPQVLAWGEVRGVFFRPADVPRRAGDGPRVRVGIHPGRGTTLDELEGVLVALDERRLVLRHADLGELSVERSRVAEIRPL